MLIAILLTSQSAYAEGTIGNVSANVSPQPAELSQNNDGSVTTSGQDPIYCTSDASGVMCYY